MFHFVLDIQDTSADYNLFHNDMNSGRWLGGMYAEVVDGEKLPYLGGIVAM